MEIIVKTFQGLEEVLAEELRAVGATGIETLSRAVACQGDLKTLYRINYEVRTAVRAITPFYTFKTKHENHLYGKIQAFDWTSHIGLDDTFAIDASTSSKYLRHSKYLSLKVKDAIVDQLRAFHDGQRPSIDLKNPTVRLQVHINKDNVCSLAWDSSGQSLHKRAYRVASVAAPINEVLAAGLILQTGWKKDSVLIDPMCGSGTILIEAALLATNTPPQIKRSHFGFMKWRNFDANLWQSVVEEAQAKITTIKYPILGYDKDINAVQATEENIKAIDLQHIVDVQWKDFLKVNTDEKKGIVIMNPPYDVRLPEEDITAFYKSIGDTLKQSFSGFDAWIISSNLDALKQIGLRTSKKIILYNAALECRFQKYELYRGSLKTKKQPF